MTVISVPLTLTYQGPRSSSYFMFYRTPDISGFDFEKQRGRPFSYFTFGASCSEVEIDCLTGDHQVNFIFYCFWNDICEVGNSNVPNQLQLEATRIITGLPIFASVILIYKELVCESLAERRKRRKLQMF